MSVDKGKARKFTRLYVDIVEEEGAFTVRVRLLNHLRTGERACGEEIAASFEGASAMIEMLAARFAIPSDCICMNISMQNYRDSVFH